MHAQKANNNTFCWISKDIIIIQSYAVSFLYVLSFFSMFLFQFRFLIAISKHTLYHSNQTLVISWFGGDNITVIYTISLWWNIAAGRGHIACIPLHLSKTFRCIFAAKYAQFKIYPFRKYWDQGWNQHFLMKESLFLVFLWNNDKLWYENRQLLLTGCKLNCMLTWFGSCCLKRIMKTGQTWPYRKDRDDCNDRVTPNSPKDSNNAPLFSK